MGALDAARGGLGGFPYGTGAISGGAISRPGGEPPVFSLRSPRNYRGRVAAAIPTAGLVLPAASNAPTDPVTYSIANLPSGLAFDASTRKITGSPTAAHAAREVTYTATDSSTPAEVLAQTFEFPVVSSTADLTLDDWNNRGYGLETRTPYILALLESTVQVGFSNIIVWRQPPSGSTIGLLVDEDGNFSTDFSGMTFTAAGETLFVSRMDFLISQDRVELRETTDAHFGGYISGTLGAPSLFLQTLAGGEQEVPYDRGFGANAQWRRDTPDLGAFLSTIDSGVLYILAVAPT